MNSALLINWTVATALQTLLLSLLKPILETIPGMRPNDPEHDALLRLVSAALAIVSVVLLAASAGTLSGANALALIMQALYQFAGSQALYVTVTRSGKSVTTSAASVTRQAGAAVAPAVAGLAAPASFALPPNALSAGANALKVTKEPPVFQVAPSPAAFAPAAYSNGVNTTPTSVEPVTTTTTGPAAPADDPAPVSPSADDGAARPPAAPSAPKASARSRKTPAS